MSESKRSAGGRKNKAVALKYNVEEDIAPVIIAAGYGEIAERIIDVAEKKGIPVFRDDSAASLMCMLEVGSNIPRELYEVVAAIYCQLLDVSAAIKNREPAPAPRRELPGLRRRTRPRPQESSPSDSSEPASPANGPLANGQRTDERNNGTGGI